MPFEKGARVLYKQKDGRFVPGKVVSVDLAVLPRSYGVHLDETDTVRETESPRLSLNSEAAPAEDQEEFGSFSEAPAVPAAVVWQDSTLSLPTLQTSAAAEEEDDSFGDDVFSEFASAGQGTAPGEAEPMAVSPDRCAPLPRSLFGEEEEDEDQAGDTRLGHAWGDQLWLPTALPHPSALAQPVPVPQQAPTLMTGGALQPVEGNPDINGLARDLYQGNTGSSAPVLPQPQPAGLALQSVGSPTGPANGFVPELRQPEGGPAAYARQPLGLASRSQLTRQSAPWPMPQSMVAANGEAHAARQGGQAKWLPVAQHGAGVPTWLQARAEGPPVDAPQPAVPGPAQSYWQPQEAPMPMANVLHAFASPSIASATIGTACIERAPSIRLQSAYADAWCQLMQACAAELEDGRGKWHKAVQQGSADELLTSPAGRAYLQALREVYLASCLLQASVDAYHTPATAPPHFAASQRRCTDAYHDQGLEQAMRQLRVEDEHDLGCIAAAAQEVGSMQSVPAWQPQLCSISLLPLERLASLGQVAWVNGRPCLVVLANLWANRVEQPWLAL